MKTIAKYLTIIIITSGTMFTACVSKKKMKASAARIEQLKKDSIATHHKLDTKLATITKKQEVHETHVVKQETDFLRGYAAGFSAGRYKSNSRDGMGEPLKENLSKFSLGPWRVGSHMMGETIPKESNFVALDKTLVDPWGIPQLRINVDYDDNDVKMTKDFFEQLSEMYTKAGFKNIRTNDSNRTPGLDIHEMGGARMGKDPKNLNAQ